MSEKTVSDDDRRTVLRLLCSGVRAEAKRQRCSPLNKQKWPAYGTFLADLYDGADLVLEIERHLSPRYVMSDGAVAVLLPGTDDPTRLVTDTAAARWLSEAVEFWCDVTPDPESLRAAIAELDRREHARLTGAAPVQDDYEGTGE